MASPVYRSEDPNAPVRLAVLGDSTAFTGPQGPLLPDEPLLYPNVAASLLSERLGRPVAVNVLGHPGSGVRNTYYSVTKDRHVMFEVLMKADAVVVGVGSFDTAPAGVPPMLETVVKALPYPRVRKHLRAALRAVHPLGVRLTLGAFARVGPGEYERLYERILFHVRALTWGAPTVVLGPTSHRSAYYGHTHPQHPHRTRIMQSLAEHHRMPFVECWPLVEPFADKLNVDGIHWPFEAHEDVGIAVAEALLPQIKGEVPSPGIPGYEQEA
jgi:hypothetical protein